MRCAGTGLVKATRGARFIANLLDNLLVGALPVAVIATSTFLSKKAGRANEPLHAVSIFLLLLVGIGVQLVAQLVWRQSIGKRLLGIRVVRKNGEPIELWRLVVLRNLALQVAARFFGIVGLVDVLFIFGKEQRCLHDLIADSIVIDARRS